MPREPRNSKVKKSTFLVPIDYSHFGDPDKDPCFGKLYDLNVDECITCGDIELCGMVFAERLTKKRLIAEQAGAKDLEIEALELANDVKTYYNKLINKNHSSLRARVRTARKFQVKSEEVKNFIA